MVNDQVFPIRDHMKAEQAYSIPRNIAAIEVLGPGQQGAKLGAVTQLPSSAHVEICGSGFNERTVKIRSNGHYYFVFWQDLMAGVA
jgi:hypothetical protein